LFAASLGFKEAEMFALGNDERASVSAPPKVSF
jgi:hypothetical protein